MYISITPRDVASKLGMLSCFDTLLHIPAAAVLSGLGGTTSGRQADLGVDEEAESDFTSKLCYAPTFNMARRIV